MIESTDAPTGHPLCCFTEPLLFLGNERILKNGNKLEGTTKETLCNDTDFFRLEERKLEGDTVNSVWAHTTAEPVEVVLKGIDFSKATDWMVTNGHDYLEASLVSHDADVDTKLVGAFEKQHPAAIFDEAMTFLARDVPNFPRNMPCTMPFSPAAASSDFQTPLKTGVALPS